MNETNTTPNWKIAQGPAIVSEVKFAPLVELRLTIRKAHAEASLTNLPEYAAKLITEIGNLDRAHGGDGVTFVQYGSRAEAGKLVLRLVPNRQDATARDRLALVVSAVNEQMRRARTALVAQQDAEYAERAKVLAEGARPSNAPPAEFSDTDTALELV
jgi:hypothetical protein